MFIVEGQAMTLSAVVEQLGTIGTYLMGQVGEVFKVIQTYPIALIPVGITLMFVAVKFTKYILGL